MERLSVDEKALLAMSGRLSRLRKRLLRDVGRQTENTKPTPVNEKTLPVNKRTLRQDKRRTSRLSS
jgi:hypothetical protein